LGHANEHGISANTRFEVCIAKDYPETAFDLAAFFDCLFTTWATWATRPARRRSLKPDGTWMVVEPMAGDRLEDTRSGHHTPICAFSCPRVDSSLPLIPREAD
jgi:hypothetical protein